MENQHDKPDEPRGAGGPESPVHVAQDEGERDHELFAHEPESHESGPHEAEIVAPEAALEMAPEPAIATPYFTRMSSASISARPMTGMPSARASVSSGLSGRMALE